MIASDRILGLVVVLGALAFFAGALQIETSFLSDPLGPRTFPMIVAAVGLLSGLIILWRPDESPEWPTGANLAHMAIAFVVLVAYAYMLAPFGFLLATALTAGVISYQIRPRLLPAVVTGASLSAGLFLIFKYALGLGLMALPRTFIG